MSLYASGLRVDECLGGAGDADADLGREVHVWHDGDVDDVWSATEPRDRLR
ncbi:MAG: hypothetical protein ABI609_06935 [Acidobacteriota bacterium]